MEHEWTRGIALFGAALAVYGAVLSTVTAIDQRGTTRPVVRVSLSHFVTSAPVFGMQVGITIKCENRDILPVRLVSVGLKIPGERVLAIPIPNTVGPWPRDVDSGHGSEVFIDPEQIAQTLVEVGHNGHVRVRPYFLDDAGRQFRGPRWFFDTNSHHAGRPTLGYLWRRAKEKWAARSK